MVFISLLIRAVSLISARCPLSQSSMDDSLFPPSASCFLFHSCSLHTRPHSTVHYFQVHQKVELFWNTGILVSRIDNFSNCLSRMPIEFVLVRLVPLGPSTLIRSKRRYPPIFLTTFSSIALIFSISLLSLYSLVLSLLRSKSDWCNPPLAHYSSFVRLPFDLFLSPFQLTLFTHPRIYPFRIFKFILCNMNSNSDLVSSEGSGL